ncbi:MAG: hypothetical protein JWP32_1120 [Schumannella sp.]|nr:hypothetical protein [Schumannella sp.]
MPGRDRALCPVDRVRAGELHRVDQLHSHRCCLGEFSGLLGTRVSQARGSLCRTSRFTRPGCLGVSGNCRDSLVARSPRVGRDAPTAGHYLGLHRRRDLGSCRGIDRHCKQDHARSRNCRCCRGPGRRQRSWVHDSVRACRFAGSGSRERAVSEWFRNLVTVRPRCRSDDSSGRFHTSGRINGWIDRAFRPSCVLRRCQVRDGCGQHCGQYQRSLARVSIRSWKRLSQCPALATFLRSVASRSRAHDRTCSTRLARSIGRPALLGSSVG